MGWFYGTAVDAENNPIAFSISGGADQSLFEINRASGALNFKTAPNFETPADADAVIMVENIHQIDEQKVEIQAAAYPWQHLRKWRAERDNAASSAALSAVEKAAGTEDNLMPVIGKEVVGLRQTRGDQEAFAGYARTIAGVIAGMTSSERESE